MKNTMKNTIAVFILSLLVCAGSAIAWPWGNVGLNVDVPHEQLDIGGSAMVRSNLYLGGPADPGLDAQSGRLYLFDNSYSEYRFTLTVVDEGWELRRNDGMIWLFYGNSLGMIAPDKAQFWIEPQFAPNAPGVLFRLVQTNGTVNAWTNTP